MRCGCALRSSSAARPTKSSSVSQVDREPDARLERVDLVVELVAREDQPRLDAKDVERLEPERRQAVIARRPPRSRPTPQARPRGGTRPRSRARPCNRCARRRPGSRRTSPIRPTVKRNHLRSSRDVCVGGVQTIFFSSSRLSGPWTATLCSWSVDGLTQTLSSCRSAQLLQPDAVVLVSADEAEVVLREPVDGRVVDHPARLVADRRVRDLPDRERRASRVIASWISDSASGPSTSHLRSGDKSMTATFSRQAQYSRDGALVVEAMRKPVAAVLDEALRSSLVRGWKVVSRVSTGSASAVTRRAIATEKRVVGRVDADVDRRDLPAVRGVDVVRAAPRTRTRGRSSPAGARSRRASTTARP